MGGGVHFSVSKDIQQFEEIIQNTFSFHAYTLDKEINKMRTDRITRNVKPVCHVNLSGLDVDGASTNASRGCRDEVHHVYLKDYNKTMCGQTNKHKAKLFRCRFCQRGFREETSFNSHTVKGCVTNEVQSKFMPEEKERKIFQKHYKNLRRPHVTYDGCECFSNLVGRRYEGDLSRT